MRKQIKKKLSPYSLTLTIRRCKKISLIKLNKYSGNYANFQVRVDLLIQASIYTIKGSLSHSTVLTIQTIRYDYLIKFKYNN